MKASEICKCFTNSLNSNNLPPCLSIDKLANFGKFQPSLYINCKPRKLCPLECNSVFYDNSISFALFPSNIYLGLVQVKYPNLGLLLNNDWNASSVRDKVLAINVYFDTLEFTTIDELEKNELIDLIAAMGGLLGLFLGMSFITFFEYAELFIMFCVPLMPQKRKIK